MSAVRSDVANLFGAFLGLSVWGLYSGLFWVTMWTILRLRKAPLRGPVVGAIIVIYVLNLAATVSSIIKTYQAFVLYPTGPTQYFDDGKDSVFNAIANFVMITVTIIADSTVAWRLYVIWNRDKRLLIIPVLALIFGVVGGTVITVYDIMYCVRGWFPAYGKPYDTWTIALYAATIVYNWFVTALIVWRLRWADPGYRVDPYGPQAGTYTRVIISLVECGGLYSVALIAFAIAYIISPGGVAHILAPAMPQIVGIVPLLICLQRALGYAHPNDTPDSSRADWSASNSATARTFGTRSSLVKEAEDYEMIKSKWLADPVPSNGQLDNEPSSSRTGGPRAPLSVRIKRSIQFK